MISLVRGEVAVRRADHVVVLTASGVGYRLAVSAETLRHVPAVGKAVTLHSHLVVRDDALALYGFFAEEERDLFLALIGVQSVGPKVALAVLSGGTPRELVVGARVRRRRPPAGRAGHRQAHRRADRRRAAREGRRRAARGEEIVITRSDGPQRLARDGLVELGFSLVEADEAAARPHRRQRPRRSSPSALRAARK